MGVVGDGCRGLILNLYAIAFRRSSTYILWRDEGSMEENTASRGGTSLARASATSLEVRLQNLSSYEFNCFSF